MSDTLSVPSLGLATTTNNERRRQENHLPHYTNTASSNSSPRLTFPSNVAPSITNTATASTPPLSSPSLSRSHSSTPTSSPPPPATVTTAPTETGAVVRLDDASPIVLFTLQYSVAMVQGVTIYILSVVFSILQLVSGQLNDASPPSSYSSSGTANMAAGARKKISAGMSDEEEKRRKQQQRRRRWSGSEGGNGSTTTATWARNLIPHIQQEQAQQGHQIRPQSPSSHADKQAASTSGTGSAGGGSLAQRLEVLRFLGSTIATLVGGGYTSFGSSAASMFSSGEEKGDLHSTEGEAVRGEGEEKNYTSRIRRALVKTLSGHTLPITRGNKRVTFNDHVQFHTTTDRRRPTRFDDEDEDENGDGGSTSSSPVLRFFSAGFSATGLLPEEPMSSSPSPATPIAESGGMKGQKRKNNRPPSIMPSARDRRQLQEQDELEDTMAHSRASGFSVVSNGRSIPVLTTTVPPRTSTVTKKLVSTITISLPPLSRPRKQQQQPPLSPGIMSTTATGTATTSITTTNMVSTPTSANFSPGTGVTGGAAGGLASALLSSLMMPAAPAPISDAARSLLTTSPTSPGSMGENSAAVLSDSDSSKSSGQRIDLKRTRSAPSKITSFLQQRGLPKQQQQQQTQMHGLFPPGEYTQSTPLASSLSSSSAPALTVDIGRANSSNVAAPSTAPSSLSASSGTTRTITSVTPTSPTASQTSPRSLHPIHSTVSATVSSGVAAVVGTDLPPPSVPTSLTTSMSLFLSSANSTNGALLSPRLGPVGSVRKHQRKRSASVDLSGLVSTTTVMMASGMSSPMTRSESEAGSGVSPPTPTTMAGSGGRSLMYKLTHPQRYKRELELGLQFQKQSKDINSLSSATSSPSASQIALPTTLSTTSVTSITSSSSTSSAQERPSSSSTVASGIVSPTRVVYPFSRPFADLPASLSYLSDHPPSPSPPPHSYSAANDTMNESAPSPTLSPALFPAVTTTTVDATGEIYQPHPPTSSADDTEKEMMAQEESTTPPLSLFFPSPTTQHRASSSSRLLSSSPPTSAAAMLSNVKDSLSHLRRSPSPKTSSGEGGRKEPAPMVEDDCSHAHTTFAACGFSLSSSSTSSLAS